MSAGALYFVSAIALIATEGIDEIMRMVAQSLVFLGVAAMGCYVALISKEPLEKVAELLGKVAELPGKATDSLLDCLCLALRCLYHGVCGVCGVCWKYASWVQTR